jgi:hypothetical protein
MIKFFTDRLLCVLIGLFVLTLGLISPQLTLKSVAKAVLTAMEDN